MKILKAIVLYYLVAFTQTTAAIAMASEQRDYLGAPELAFVRIGPNAVAMPLGRILLIRKASEYCAVKFNELWTRSELAGSARYESHYQGDKTGDFSNKNVQFKRGELRSPRILGFGGGHRYSIWGKEEVQCGPIKFFWTFKTWVYFFSGGQVPGDYGIEFAPTKWTDISHVNVFDPRLKWYRYDTKRKDVDIPVDQFWENKEEEKK